MVAETLDRYVETKFSEAQKKELIEAARTRMPVEVHGVFSFYIDELLAHLGLRLNREARRDSRPGKRFNNRRPSLFHCTDADGHARLLALVSPSKEYVSQHAELLEYFLVKHAPASEKGPKPFVTTFHYRTVERDFAPLTGFKAGLASVVTPGDIVVLGEVDYLSASLRRYNFKPEKDTFEPFGVQNTYGWKLHVSDTTHRRLLLVGCEESYWGSAAAKLARELADLGAKHIIYSAKCGTAHEARLIHTPACPSEYHICEQSEVAAGPLSYNVVKIKNAPPSSLRDNYVGLTKALDTGTHLTVPTVMGETIKQQREYGNLPIGTIDNEISYIARELADYNRQTEMRDSPVEFTALHFVTDYVRRESDRDSLPGSDLAHKGSKVDEPKQKCFNTIAAIIDTYAYHEGQPAEDQGQYGILQAISSWARLKEEIRQLGQGHRRVYWRRDFPKLLDGWVAAYYLEDLPAYQVLIEQISATRLLRGPNMEPAVEWCLLACEFARLTSAPQGDSGLLRYENLIGIAQANLDALEFEAQTQPPFNQPSKILRAIYCDLIGACLARLATCETRPRAREQISHLAIDVLTKALSFISQSSAPSSTRVIWQCWIERYMAIALHGVGQRKKARDMAVGAARRFEEFLTEHEVQRSSFTGMFLYGELSMLRMKAIEIGGKDVVKSWPAELKDYYDGETMTFFKTVRQMYERIFGKSSKR